MRLVKFIKFKFGGRSIDLKGQREHGQSAFHTGKEYELGPLEEFYHRMSVDGVKIRQFEYEQALQFAIQLCNGAMIDDEYILFFDSKSNAFRIKRDYVIAKVLKGSTVHEFRELQGAAEYVKDLNNPENDRTINLQVVDDLAKAIRKEHPNPFTDSEYIKMYTVEKEKKIINPHTSVNIFDKGKTSEVSTLLKEVSDVINGKGGGA